MPTALALSSRGVTDIENDSKVTGRTLTNVTLHFGLSILLDKTQSARLAHHELARNNVNARLGRGVVRTNDRAALVEYFI